MLRTADVTDTLTDCQDATSNRSCDVGSSADVVCWLQVVSFDNLEDQELEKRDVTEGWFLSLS